VVEYGVLLSAVAVLAVGIAGLNARTAEKLPTSAAVALEAVGAVARSQQVSVPGARAAYRRAPYSRPSLRYVFATGWVVGSRNRTFCRLTSLAPNAAERRAVEEFQRNGKARTTLRRLRVTPQQAGSALVRGLVSACA
jgi:hypothetical protein